MSVSHPILSERAAAKFLGMRHGVLCALRRLGLGPPYLPLVKAGCEDLPPTISYLEEDLLAWAISRRTEPGAAAQAAWGGSGQDLESA